jgi:hypothetical protein
MTLLTQAYLSRQQLSAIDHRMPVPPQIVPKVVTNTVTTWTEATEHCLDLWTKGWLAQGDYRGSGRTVSECIMGRVSQDCGGNRYDA